MARHRHRLSTGKGSSWRLRHLPEERFTLQVTSEARRRGWLWYHTRTSIGSPSGMPDLVLVREETILWELKRETGTLAPTQAEFLLGLVGTGVRAEVCRPSDGLYMLRTLEDPESTEREYFYRVRRQVGEWMKLLAT